MFPNSFTLATIQVSYKPILALISKKVGLP